MSFLSFSFLPSFLPNRIRCKTCISNLETSLLLFVHAVQWSVVDYERCVNSQLSISWSLCVSSAYSFISYLDSCRQCFYFELLKVLSVFITDWLTNLWSKRLAGGIFRVLDLRILKKFRFISDVIQTIVVIFVVVHLATMTLRLSILDARESVTNGICLELWANNAGTLWRYNITTVFHFTKLEFCLKL